MKTSRQRMTNDGIFLGWQAPAKRSLGFSRRADESRTDVITFNGPHLLSIAPSGAGKATCAAIPTLLQYPGQAIVLDIKGELYTTTHRTRRAMGQQVIRLDPFRVVDASTDSLNPLDILKLPGADIETDCQSLAKLLSIGKESNRDPFWHLTANGLNAGILTSIATDEDNTRRNLIRMIDMLFGDDVVYQLAVFLDTKGKKIPRLAYREISAFLQLPERDTRPSALATAQSFVKCLDAARVSEALANSTIDLEDLRKGMPLTIYLVIPPERLSSHAALVSLWIGTLLQTIFSRQQIPSLRTLLLLDEAASLGHFPMLETAITLCRSYGVRVWTFWQDLQQIKSCYPSGWQTIVNNCGIQVFGINSKLMARELSEVLDCSTKQLLALEQEQQFLQLAEYRAPIIAELPNYLHHQRYAGLFDPNGFYTLTDLAEPDRLHAQGVATRS
ncbi:MAG: type IV secretory system conjugative DNA transfer family protein [Planctomycetaceae bacterium]|nr:type IV secretory system conjugative DNA transfer family protein [Planctomycetaceae bacterium]